MPGEDFAESLRLVLGELPDLPHLPELPARGAVADMTGRTLGGDRRSRLRPAARRLAAHRRPRGRPPAGAVAAGAGPRHVRGADPGLRGPAQGAAHRPVDAGRARSRSRAATRCSPTSAPVASWPRRSRRESRTHLADVRRRVPGASLLLQVDEPALPGVMAGQVRRPPASAGTARSPRRSRPRRSSGCSRRPATSPWSRTAAPPSRRSRCSGAPAPGECRSTWRCSRPGRTTTWPPRSTRARGSCSASSPRPASRHRPTKAAVERVQRLLDMLGFDPAEVADQLVLTPACGMAGASASYARSALRTVREAAAELG